MQLMYVTAAVLCGLVAGGMVGYATRRDKLGLFGKGGTRKQMGLSLLCMGCVFAMDAVLRTLDRTQEAEPSTQYLAIGCLVVFAFVGYLLGKRLKQ